MYKKYTLVIGLLILLFSCAENKTDGHIVKVDSLTLKITEPGPTTEQVFDVKAFAVTDSTTNKTLGWGYDIYINDKRSIHQPHIPAIEGNHYFETEADALKTGNFAAQKMQITGSLPTLSIKELDSLGVLKK